MANQHRGQTGFRALGREMYLVYGTREIAEAWSALGFRRADPLAPPLAEERDEPALDKTTGNPLVDETGPVFVRRRVLLDAATRQERVQEAFDAVFTNPEVPARRTCVRIGLRRWEREVGQPLSDEEFERLCDELGLGGLSALHVAAWINACRVPPAEESPAEAGEGRSPKGSTAFSTLSTS